MVQVADVHEHAQLKAEIRKVKAEHHFEKEAAQKSSDKNVNVNVNVSEGASSSQGEVKDSTSDSSDYEGMAPLVWSSSGEDIYGNFEFRNCYADSPGDAATALRFCEAYSRFCEGTSSSDGEATDSKSDSSDYEGIVPPLVSSISPDEDSETPSGSPEKRQGDRTDPRWNPKKGQGFSADPKEYEGAQENKEYRNCAESPGDEATALRFYEGFSRRNVKYVRFLQARLDPPAAEPTRADGKQSHHEKAFAVYTAKCSQWATVQDKLEAVLRIQNYMARSDEPDRRQVNRWGNLAEFKLMVHKKYYDEQALKHAKKMRMAQAFTSRSLK